MRGEATTSRSEGAILTCSEAERTTRREQVCPVDVLSQPHRLREPGGPGTQRDQGLLQRRFLGRASEQSGRPIAWQLDASATRHECQSSQGLQRSDQRGLAASSGSGDHVDAPVDAVGEVDIGVSGTLEHDPVSRGSASEGVRRRVGFAVRLRLDDDAARGAFLCPMDKHGAQELPGGSRWRAQQRFDGKHGGHGVHVMAAGECKASGERWRRCSSSGSVSSSYWFWWWRAGVWPTCCARAPCRHPASWSRPGRCGCRAGFGGGLGPARADAALPNRRGVEGNRLAGGCRCRDADRRTGRLHR